MWRVKALGTVGFIVVAILFYCFFGRSHKDVAGVVSQTLLTKINDACPLSPTPERVIDVSNASVAVVLIVTALAYLSRQLNTPTSGAALIVRVKDLTCCFIQSQLSWLWRSLRYLPFHAWAAAVSEPESDGLRVGQVKIGGMAHVSGEYTHLANNVALGAGLIFTAAFLLLTVPVALRLRRASQLYVDYSEEQARLSGERFDPAAAHAR